MTVQVPFVSLAPGPDAPTVRQAIDRVVRSGWFVLGPEVEAFEAEFATAMGGAAAVGVASGTDALALSLRALGVGPGDEVITTSLSAAYTALAIAMIGARPVFADIDSERLTIDAGAVERAISDRTRALVPVHLYGQPADMEALARVAARHSLPIVEDCCQAHLATAGGRPVGTIGAAGAFSFYPTKNLGALGDGGAILTNDQTLAARLRRLRNGGQTDRYHHADLGVNSRLDEIQAAVLRARLPGLAAGTAHRRALAARYRAGLAGSAVAPVPERDAGHVYHLFVVRSPDRDRLQAHCTAAGIETLIHYPIPIPGQPAFARFATASCPDADRACAEVLSLPIGGHLSPPQLEQVVACVRAFPADAE